MQAISSGEPRRLFGVVLVQHPQHGQGTHAAVYGAISCRCSCALDFVPMNMSSSPAAWGVIA